MLETDTGTDTGTSGVMDGAVLEKRGVCQPGGQECRLVEKDLADQKRGSRERSKF